ncbi:MAG TPA: hypothetical protein VIQ80_01120 [Candidatus Saccharimonadales bacterium]
MNKDVIYIDVEDDITAIIGRVKDSKEKIVALVPPKRIGVLQSAVNLRLLERAATQHSKRLVIISNNSALMALAAAAKIPVAKNLQSKPEIAQVAAVNVDGEDIIDGAQLPIGELARTADKNALGAAALSSAAEDTKPSLASPPRAGEALKRPKAKGGIKVPNFNTFRKRLVLGIAGGVLLVSFLVWALFFAPSATVIITARTTDSSANDKVALGDSLATSFSAGTVKTVSQTVKKDVNANITPTGTKDVGTKATGTMKITRTSVSNQSMSVPAGTTFTANGLSYASTQDATLNGTTVGANGLVQDSATVNVQAADIGDNYNLSARSYSSNVGGITAQGSDMTGGTKKTVTVVTDSDAQKALDQITQQSTDSIKNDLKSKFNDTFIVLDQTFTQAQGNPQVTPTVGQEVPAGTQPTLAVTITYSLAGITKADVGRFLDDYFADQIKGLSDRRVYDNGSSKVSFTNITQSDKGFSANMVATAKIGPKIEDQKVKDSAKGKRYGEIQSSIEAIQGVDNVDVKFSPFWVSTAPSDTKRINVVFNLNESK